MPGLSGADFHHFRPGRYCDGGRCHQERRPRFHREAVSRQRHRVARCARRSKRTSGAKPMLISSKASSFHFPRPRAVDATRAGRADPDRGRRLEQGGRPPARDQPAHHRGCTGHGSWPSSGPRTPPTSSASSTTKDAASNRVVHSCACPYSENRRPLFHSASIRGV